MRWLPAGILPDTTPQRPLTAGSPPVHAAHRTGYVWFATGRLILIFCHTCSRRCRAAAARSSPCKIAAGRLRFRPASAQTLRRRSAQGWLGRTVVPGADCGRFHLAYAPSGEAFPRTRS